MADEQDKENDALKSEAGRKPSSSKKKRKKRRGENPNPGWQKKLGRTSVQNNVYDIFDVEEKGCGASNEWFTPRTSSNCASCTFCIALIGLILTIFAFAIDMNSWYTEYAEASCDDIPRVGDKVEAFQGWEYLSACIIVASIVTTCSSCYSFWNDKRFVIDQNGKPKHDIDDWDMSTTRILCRCQIFLWIALFVLIFVWFWIMVAIMAGLDDIASTVNCVPDSVQEAASKKLLSFGILIALSIIGALCCGMPMAVAYVYGRADDDRTGL